MFQAEVGANKTGSLPVSSEKHAEWTVYTVDPSVAEFGCGRVVI